MSTTPARAPLPTAGGRLRFAVFGYAIRAVKVLPAPLRDKIIGSASGGLTGNLPPFADIRRLLEVAGGLPSTRLWADRPLRDRPDLRAVRTRDISDDQDGRPRARVYLPPTDAPASRFSPWTTGTA